MSSRDTLRGVAHCTGIIIGAQLPGAIVIGLLRWLAHRNRSIEPAVRTQPAAIMLHRWDDEIGTITDDDFGRW